MSYLWKIFKMKRYMKKHLPKKHYILFCFQVGDIKILDVVYKIQKFLRTSGAPIITTNGINFLMAGPLVRTCHIFLGLGHCALSCFY